MKFFYGLGEYSNNLILYRSQETKCMAKINRARGTSSTETDNTDPSWAGEDFKKKQAEIKEQHGDETIGSARGTSRKKLKDIPTTESPDTEGVSRTSNRGTSSD